MSIAVVTGAGIRVGRAIALALARDGFDVVVHANRSPPDDTAREIQALGRKAYVERADLADLDAVEALAKRIVALPAVAQGGVDVLVNSAGAYEKLDFANVTRARFLAMQTVNAHAPYFLTQGLVSALATAGASREGGAAVVNIVDIAADRPISGYSHYMMSKASLAMMTKALALELAAQKIRVNGVAPGTVEWPPDFTDAQKAPIAKRIPMGAVGSADDVAAAVSFLVSAKAKFTTGAILPVDGGRSAVH